VLAKQRFWLLLIVILVIGAIVTVSQIPVRLGLDLRGGTQLTLQAQPTNKVPEIDAKVLEGVRQVVEGRLDPEGVSEILVQTSGSDQLLVQLPGVSDPAEAERLLSQAAKLDFREETASGEFQAELQVRRQELVELLQRQGQLEGAQEADAAAIATLQAQIQAKQQQLDALSTKLYEPTELTGENLRDAEARPRGPGSGDWAVVVYFDTQGARLFAELTKSVAGTGRTLGIFLDDRLISAPSVAADYASTGITGGSAEISGNFTAETANELAVQLQGGALPVPIKIVENRTVGATLGQDSVRRSVYAALGGSVLVLVFMGLYYRLPGLIADVALCVYGLLTFAIFVLVGVTLTLPGIAGFILSIGMAVDANILIFERTREELRAGKTLYRSIESGFYRAFSSILDSNITTLIACGALYWLGTGLVKGFALTLSIGVCVSMFTAITCSRTLMFTAISFPNLRKPELFGSQKVEVVS
jgi:preprotein translocase subunit SecD